jgi:hypothetical protein
MKRSQALSRRVDGVLAIVRYFVWIIYVRVVIEFLVAAFRTAENIARVSAPGGREG